MAESSALRRKGPLLRPKQTATEQAYSEKVKIDSGIDFTISTNGKKVKKTKAKPFDSSGIPSPFLDPKIIERKVNAARKPL